MVPISSQVDCHSIPAPDELTGSPNCRRQHSYLGHLWEPSRSLPIRQLTDKKVADPRQYLAPSDVPRAAKNIERTRPDDIGDRPQRRYSQGEVPDVIQLDSQHVGIRKTHSAL